MGQQTKANSNMADSLVNGALDAPSDSRSDLELYLHSIIKRVPGLRAIFVCDRDGVTLLKALAVNDKLGNDDDDDEVTLAAAFAISADQVAKVHLGRVKSATTFFASQLIVHHNVLPLVVALVAEPEANAGLLIALNDDLTNALSSLRDSVEQLDK